MPLVFRSRSYGFVAKVRLSRVAGTTMVVTGGAADLGRSAVTVIASSCRILVLSCFIVESRWAQAGAATLTSAVTQPMTYPRATCGTRAVFFTLHPSSRPVRPDERPAIFAVGSARATAQSKLGSG